VAGLAAASCQAASLVFPPLERGYVFWQESKNLILVVDALALKAPLPVALDASGVICLDDVDNPQITGRHRGNLRVPSLDLLGHAKFMVAARVSVAHQIDIAFYGSPASPSPLWAAPPAEKRMTALSLRLPSALAVSGTSREAGAQVAPSRLVPFGTPRSWETLHHGDEPLHDLSGLETV